MGEANFEKDFIEMLVSQGWDGNIIKNPYHKTLEENLRNIINENNIDKLGSSDQLTDAEFAQIMDKINSDCTTPVAANVFINSKQVTIKSEINRQKYKVGDEIYLDIFDPVEVAGGKSRYQIAEQIYFNTDPKYNNRRGDLMLLINGLPVIHIELKASGHNLEEGTMQIQKYMNEGVFKGLFSLIQVFFVATPEDIIYFANSYPTLNPTFMFHWGDNKNNQIHNWQQLIKGPSQILSIPEAHQLVGYYTSASIEKDSNGCIENINNGILMVARSYQIYAIRNIMKRVKLQRWGTHTPLGGYVWGTTGCGKTFTSYKSGQLITDKNFADKVVFVVDRVELSDQSYKEYNSFARDGEPIAKSKSTYDLFKLLSDDKHRLVITSIQKLSRVNEEKSKYVNKVDIDKINKKRIVFVIDEAHRSQFGEMHEHIKSTFTTALFIGFTGTPIFSENDKAEGMTSEITFGDCLAVYSIASGIRDKNVLGFSPTMVRTFEDKTLKDAIACDRAKVSSKDEAKKDPAKWKIYKDTLNYDMKTIEKMLPPNQYNCPQHRAAVVKDIESGWEVLSNEGGAIRFHALLATNSIAEAIEYYRLLKVSKTHVKVTALFDPNTNGDSQAVINKEKAIVEIIDDYNKMFGTGNIINREADPSLKSFKSDITARLAHKGPYKHISEADMIDIVIVVDQLLTGFDSKYINTLYLDKVLETDNLIQAISRTNRVLDFDEKPWGIFKCYRQPYTMEENLTNALRLYCEGGENSGAIVKSLNENIDLANQLYKDIEKIFNDANIQNFMCLPKLDADCQKFKALFKTLAQTINGMKLQGLHWKKDDDEHVLKLDVCKKWVDGTTRIYDILYMRYKDLMPISSNTPNQHTGKLGYSIMASLSEMEKAKIDADYLEEHFKQIIPILIGDFEEVEKDMAIEEFQSQLATLSITQQEFANIIIEDIKDGKLDVGNKTLRELIAEYQTNAENQMVLDFADKYGLNVALLHKIFHMNGNHDMEISKLLETCDKEVVEKAFDCKWFAARVKLNKEIKDFIM
jgi:type I restriction enzyme R subunit